jgi:membrane-associated phospholipid phosphatase
LRGSDFDARIMRAAGRMRRPWLNSIVIPYTTAGNHGVLWVALGVVVADPIRVAATTWGTLAVNTGIKRLVRRKRPLAEELKALIRLPATTSFPSSHASMAMAAAFPLSLAHPEAASLWFVLALLMAATRVYVGAHHASDVLAGVALGTLLGAVSIAVTA